MKKNLFVLLLFAPLFLPAQPRFPEAKPRQNIYVELGGNGMAFNVVYESRLKAAADGAGFKIGAGGFSSSFENLFSVALGPNWLLSKDNKNFFEVGFGATYLHYDWKDGFFSGDEYPIDVVGLTVDQRNSVYGHLALGYRRQPANGGITWGAAITPHFNQNGIWPLWVGFKFGYSFSRK
jgi:hypothetical protein